MAGGFGKVVAARPSDALPPTLAAAPFEVGTATRLTAIDGARGFLLLTMYVAHCHFAFLGEGVSSSLQYLSFSTYLPAKSPDFFVFLSGFVCAIAYLGRFDRDGTGGVARIVLRRLRWLYTYQVAVTIIVVIVAWAVAPLPLFGSYHAPAGSPGALLLGILTFTVQPKNLDILLLYIVLMLFIPFAYGLLQARRTAAYAAFLAGAWLLAAAADRSGVASVVVVRFNPLSYAPLFYTGFFLGYRFRRPEGAIATWLLRPSRRLLAIASMLVVGLVIWRRTVEVHTPVRDNHALGIVAFVATIVVCGAVYQLLTQRDPSPAVVRITALARALLEAPILVLLGQSSLFVYSLHVLVIIPVAFAVLYGGAAVMLPAMTAGFALIVAATIAKRRWLPGLP